MAGLMYFVPDAGVGSLSLEKLGELGLGYAFDRTPFCREAAGDVPGGHRGLLVAERSRMGNFAAKVVMGEQEWHRLPGDRELYVGWYRDARPTPADLARPQMLPGYPAPMADGHEWQIPVARAAGDEGECQCQLPSTYTIDDQGRLVVGEVAARYRRLWLATEPYWYAMINEQEISDQACLEDVGIVLQTNYYIDWREAALLGLFSTEAGPGAVMALAVGYLTWVRWLAVKKKTDTPSSPTPQDSSTPAGEAS